MGGKGGGTWLYLNHLYVSQVTHLDDVLYVALAATAGCFEL